MRRADWARSFVHRGLRWTSGFATAGLSDAAAVVPCGFDETIIGIYENETGGVADAIGITDRGIRLHPCDGWRFIPYHQIARTILPPKSKEQPYTPPFLDLQLHGGEVVRLPIRGRSGEDGQFSDVYGMATFLRGMVWSLQHTEDNS